MKDEQENCGQQQNQSTYNFISSILVTINSNFANSFLLKATGKQTSDLNDYNVIKISK